MICLSNCNEKGCRCFYKVWVGKGDGILREQVVRRFIVKNGVKEWVEAEKSAPIWPSKQLNYLDLRFGEDRHSLGWHQSLPQRRSVNADVYIENKN